MTTYDNVSDRTERDAKLALMLIAAREFADVDGCTHEETLEESVRALTFAARTYYRAAKIVADIEEQSRRLKKASSTSIPKTPRQMVAMTSAAVLGAAFLYGEADVTGHSTVKLLEDLSRACLAYDDAMEVLEAITKSQPIPRTGAPAKSVAA